MLGFVLVLLVVLVFAFGLRVFVCVSKRARGQLIRLKQKRPHDASHLEGFLVFITCHNATRAIVSPRVPFQ